MIDVVICTKNRHKLLAKLVKQIKMLSYNRLVIVDSSDVPFKFETLRKDFVVHDPEARLGAARQIGLECCSSRYVFFVDDDQVLTPSCLSILHDALENSNDVNLIAVSGRVIYGNDAVLRKLFSRTRAFGQGENGGFVLLKREEILAIGGFNKKIHWGEDVELRQRMNANGLKWGRVPEAVVYQTRVFLKLLHDMKNHGKGCRASVNISGGFLRMAVRLLGRVSVMPFVYGFQTYDPRVFGYYFLMNLCLLLGFCGFSRRENL